MKLPLLSCRQLIHLNVQGFMETVYLRVSLRKMLLKFGNFLHMIMPSHFRSSTTLSHLTIFRCSTSAHLSLGCKRMFHIWCATKPKNGVVANDRLVMIPFVDNMMYNCPPSMFHFESSQALDSENCKRLTPRDFPEKRSLAASRWNIGERVGGGIVGSCQRQTINATPCSVSLFWSRCHHHASLRYKKKLKKTSLAQP